MTATALPVPSPVDDDPRRNAILRQARRHFMTQGYAATRIEPIAREAAVSTATLYAHFASKEVLFAAVIVHASDAFAAEMAKVVHGAEGSAQDQIVGSSRVDLQACKLEYSIVSPK